MQFSSTSCNLQKSHTTHFSEVKKNENLRNHSHLATSILSSNNVFGNLSSQFSKEKFIHPLNSLSAEFVGFVSRILIERNFFQNTQIPQDLLLYAAQDIIEMVSPSKKECFNLTKEFSVLWKDLRGKPLTKEEEDYDNSPKELNVVREICNGIKYSSMALLGENLFTSVTSALQQGLCKHVPFIVAYSGTLLFGSKGVSLAVDKVLQNHKFRRLNSNQKLLLKPWLNMIGRMALGFVPKVHATEKGVHYHYPSLQGYTQTVSQQQILTVHGEDLIIEKEGKFDTPAGKFEGVHSAQFKLKTILEFTQETVRIQVLNENGKEVPVTFTKTQGMHGPEIQVFSSDPVVEKYWRSFFVPKVKLPELPAGKSVFSDVPMARHLEGSLSCYTGLSIGALGSLSTYSLLPMTVGALSCLKPAHAAMVHTNEGLENSLESGIKDMNFYGVLDECEKLMKSEDTRSLALYYQGLVYRKLGNYTEAYHNFEKALEENPSNKNAMKEKSELQSFMDGEQHIVYRNAFLKELGVKVPNHYEYLVMCALAYYDSEKDKSGKKEFLSISSEVSPHWDRLKKNWSIGDSSKDFDITADGYYGVTFVNEATKHIIIAHRGTDLSGGGIFNSHGEIVLGKKPMQYAEAKRFTEEIETTYPGYVLSHAGHSLGGVLAQYVAFFRGEVAITGDSTGIRDAVIKRDNFKKAKDTHIVSYVSPPDVVNTHKPQLGDLRTISFTSFVPLSGWEIGVEAAKYAGQKLVDGFSWLVDDKSGKKSSIESKIGLTADAMKYLLNEWKSHKIVNMLQAFDPETGYAKEYRQVFKWPTSLDQKLAFDYLCTTNGLSKSNPETTQHTLKEELQNIYETQSRDLSRESLSSFSFSAQEMLLKFFEKGEYYSNFNIQILMLYHIVGREIFLRSDPRIFNMDDFKNYVEQMMVNRGEPRIYKLQKCCEEEREENKVVESLEKEKWREYNLFFSLDSVKETFKEQREIEILKEFIDTGDKSGFVTYIEMSKTLKKKIDAELLSKGVTISGKRGKVYPMDFEALKHNIFTNKPKEDLSFTKIMNRKKEDFVQKTLQIKDDKNVLLVSDVIVDFVKDCRGLHFALKRGSEVRVKLGIDCHVQGLFIRNLYNPSFYEYLKHIEGTRNEFKIIQSKDGFKVPKWLVLGKYVIEEVTNKKEINRKTFEMISEDGKHSYKIVLEKKNEEISAKLGKETESLKYESLGNFELANLKVEYSIDTYLEVDHKSVNRLISVGKLAKDNRLEILEEIRKLEDEGVELLKKEENQNFLNEAIDQLIKQRITNVQNSEFVFTEESHLSNLNIIINRISYLCGELKEQKIQGQILLKLILEANYQKYAEKKDSLSVSDAMKLFAQAHLYLNEIRDRDLILFLGMTGSGKSTSINFFLGNKLEEVSRTFASKVYNVSSLGMNFPKIGLSYTISETLFSRGFEVPDQPKFKLTDTSGLGENRGDNHELVAALSIDQTIQKARSIHSVVITVPFVYFISDRGNRVISLMTRVRELLPLNKDNIYVLITMQGDNTDDQVEDVLQQIFIEQERLQGNEERRKIWNILNSLHDKGHVDCVLLNDPIRREDLLEKYTESRIALKGSDFDSLLQTGDLVEKFSKKIEEAAGSWLNDIIQRYLSIPSNLLKCEETVKQANNTIAISEEVIRVENIELKRIEAKMKLLKEKKNKLIQLKNNFNAKDIDAQTLEELEREASKFQDESMTILNGRITRCQNLILEYQKEKKIFEKNRDNAQKKIDSFSLAIQAKINKIEELSTGIIKEQTYTYSRKSEEICTSCTLKKGATEEAWLNKRALTEKDCENEKYDKEEICAERNEDYVHYVEVKKNFRLVPKDEAMREEFIKMKVPTDSSSPYKAILDGIHYKIDKEMRVDADGKRIVYYLRTEWQRGRLPLPSINVTNEVPAVDYHDGTLINLNNEKKDLMDKRENAIRDKKRAEDNLEDVKKKLEIELQNEQSLLDEMRKEKYLEKGIDPIIKNIDAVVVEEGKNNKISKERIEQNKRTITAQKEIINKATLEKQGYHLDKRNLALIIKTRWDEALALSEFCELAVQKETQRQKEVATIGSKGELVVTCQSFKKMFKENEKFLKESCEEDLGF